MGSINQFLVSSTGSEIVLVNPPARGQRLTKDEALWLSAWLYVMATTIKPTSEELAKESFDARVEEIRGI